MLDFHGKQSENENGPRGACNTRATLTDIADVGGPRMADGSQYTPRGVILKREQRETEIWRRVHSEPGVMASNLGRVLLPPSYVPLPNGGFRRCLPVPGFGIVSRSRVGSAHEFMLVMVRSDGKNRQKPRKVHQLVCEAFHGPKPFPGAVVIHIDEDGLNNRADNLRWGTQKENLNMPKFNAYCRSRVGEDSPVAKSRSRRGHAQK